MRRQDWEEASAGSGPQPTWEEMGDGWKQEIDCSHPKRPENPQGLGGWEAASRMHMEESRAACIPPPRPHLSLLWERCPGRTA